MGQYKIRLSPKAKAELKQWEKIGDVETIRSCAFAQRTL